MAKSIKPIKTRDSVKNLKVIGSTTVNVSKRMRDTYIRTKQRAEETQNVRHDSPAEYAAETVQTTVHSGTQDTVRYLKNAPKKARDNFARAKGLFQEVKSLMPGARKQAAAQAKGASHVQTVQAAKLRKTSDQASQTAEKAKAAVKTAKQKLQQVRQAGRQTIQAAKRSARSAPGGGAPTSVSNASASPARPSVSRPGFTSASAPTKGAKTAQSAVKGTRQSARQTARHTIKTAKKSIKTAEKSAKAAVKTAKHTAKAAHHTAVTAAKTARTAERAARIAAKTAATATKLVAKGIIATTKAAIAAIKGLVAMLAAGGGVALLAIVIICMIGLLVASVFGIFFSSEPNDAGQNINGVIADIDRDFTSNLDNIKGSTTYELLDMSGARALWKDVLAIYAVRTAADPNDPTEVATVDDEKIAILQEIFWDMNTVSFSLDFPDVEQDVIGEDGLPTGETTIVSISVMRITVSHKTPEEMADAYGFTDEQRENLAELLKPEYHGLWNALLYGIATIGDGTLIEVAETQIGNIGGDIYKTWYGLESKENWCAAFISWCAEQCGYLGTVIPRFASCKVGIQWFKDRTQWQDNSYTPRSGDLIFLDWEGDGIADHVGIVESVADGRVNTIEGNTSDSVARRSYALGSSKIFGYGCPSYG